MKKSLFFLFALICSTSLFTACSDDDEVDTGWKEIPTDIPAENVTLDLNGVTVPGATAQLEIKTAETGELTLKNLIYNHDNVVVNVTMKKVSEGSYDFEGQLAVETKAHADVEADFSINVKGNVLKEGKLTVNVTTAGWGSISNVYQNDSLKVTINGKDQSSTMPVTLTATSDSKVTVLFSKIVNVANDFPVEATLTKDGNNYKIEGSAEFKPGYLVTVNGTLSSSAVLTLTVTTSGYATINRSYYASSGNDITYNGVAATNGSIDIKATSESDVTVSVNGFVPGSNSIKIEGGKLTKASDSETYTISASVKTEAYEIAFEGTISPDKKMTGAVTYKILSSIVGKWGVKMNGQTAESIFKFASQTGSVTFPSEIMAMLPADLKPYFKETMTDTEVNGAVKGLLGQYIPFLQAIEFTEGGDMIISYKEVGKTEVSTLNILKYYVKDNQVYVVIDIMSLMAGGFKSWDPSSLLTDGIPLDFSLNGNTLNVYLNREVTVGTLTFANALLPAFGELLGDKAELVMSILSTVTSIVSSSTEFEAGLVLTK